jgi:hypothetical protein
MVERFMLDVFRQVAIEIGPCPSLDRRAPGVSLSSEESTMAADEWIGVDEVAAEMRYTQRQAWEFIRSIGVASVNARKMNLIRFTRAEFNEARERAKAPIAPRSRVAPPRTNVVPTKPKNTTKAASIMAKFKNI